MDKDVKRTVNRALAKTKLKVKMGKRSKLLSDNGSCYISGQLSSFMKEEVVYIYTINHTCARRKIMALHSILEQLDNVFDKKMISP